MCQFFTIIFFKHIQQYKSMSMYDGYFQKLNQDLDNENEPVFFHINSTNHVYIFYLSVFGGKNLLRKTPAYLLE